MIKQIDQLREFMTAFGQPVSNELKFPEYKVCALAASLITEEASEVYDELHLANNLPNVTKELADLVYVALWAVNALGLQDKFVDCFDEVHASNMSKLGEDGKPIYRADGKVMKGPNYFKADLSKIL